MKKNLSEKKSEFLSIRVSKGIKLELEAVAQKEERSVSWVVGRIVENSLKRKRSK